MSKDGNYKMNHAKRGVALVINIRSYNPNPNKLQERKWSAKDVENLKHTLEYLEFDFKLCQNLTKTQIEQEIQRQASIDHSNSDCFLCVVMSHGNEDKIVASDNQEISFKEMMAPIKSCKSLMNKPKMYFFQACRGENEMEIPCVLSRQDSIVSTANENTNSDGNTQINNRDAQSLNTNKKTLITAESDLLVYNATLPKHFAFGTEKEGTFFIKSVCEVLNEAYKELPYNMPLSKMILSINKSVRDSGIQLADPINHLLADVYFSPKNVSFNFKLVTFVFC
jgi:hypothetical protein